MEPRLLHTITAHRRAVGDFMVVAVIVALLVSMILALAVAIVPAAEPSASQPNAAGVPSATAAAPPDSAPSAPAAPDSFAIIDDPSISFRLELGNRMYPNWKDSLEARLNVEFPIGDTENSGKIVKFLPSFMIVDGKPRSESRAMDNPAVRVMVYYKGAPKDSSWAFLNFPPHFSPRSFYTFQLKSIEGYPKSKAAAASRPSAAKPGAKPAPSKSKTKTSGGGGK